MKRRNFMQMLGLAPAAALVAPAEAEIVPQTELEEAWIGGEWDSWDNNKTFTEMVTTTLRKHRKEITDNVSDPEDDDDYDEYDD